MTRQSKYGKDNSFYGKHHSKETREYLSKINKERCESPEYIEKMRLAHIGIRHTPESATKISLALLKSYNSEDTVEKLLDRDWLYNQYVVNEMSVQELSIELGVTQNAIRKSLHRHNIHVRNKKESLKTNRLKNKRIEYLKEHGNPMNNPDSRAKLQGKNHPLYGKTHTQAAREKISKNHANVCGKNNPRWLGGISFEPYCPKFNNDLRARIRAFFEHRCILCGEHESNLSRRLSCHHVEYNKEACCDGKPVRFATLCLACHAKTNVDRDRWMLMIHRVIDEIYHGRSYFTKEEITEDCP